MNSAEAYLNITGKAPSKRKGTALSENLHTFVCKGVEYLFFQTSKSKTGLREQKTLLLFSEFSFFRQSIYFITGLVLLHLEDLILKLHAESAHRISRDAYSPAEPHNSSTLEKLLSTRVTGIYRLCSHTSESQDLLGAHEHPPFQRR